MKDWIKKLLENKDNGEAPFFKLLREQESDKVENPKFEWAINERTNTIGDWILVGTNIDNNEIWFNKKTRKIYEGSIN